MMANADLSARLKLVVALGAFAVGFSVASFSPVAAADPAALERAGTTILAQRCIKCHNSEKLSSGLDLTQRVSALRGGDSGAALVPGAAQESLLFEKVRDGEMPPKEPLPARERQALRDWIAAGAPWSEILKPAVQPRAEADWWSLQPLQDPAPPSMEGVPEAWTRSPIDRFVFAHLREKGLEPSPPADRRTLIRRATYDLTGLPPTPEAVAAFVADSSPEAYSRLLDRLLSSPHYGERWGRHWLDVVRFGESHGYEQNHLRANAWPFRDYVIRSFNADKPFDQLVLEHLAGDQVGAGDPDVEVGTGFLVAGTYDTVDIDNIEGMLQQRANNLDDMLSTTIATFMGLTANCARCHDHKFDPILQRDYYRLQAVFAGVVHGEREVATPEKKAQRDAAAAEISAALEDVTGKIEALETEALKRAEGRRDELLSDLRPPVSSRGTEERFDPVRARFVRMEVHKTDRSSATIDEFEVWSSGDSPQNVALLSAGAQASARATRSSDGDTSFYSPTFAIDGEFGQAWISGERPQAQLTVALGSEHVINRVYWSRDRLGGFTGVFQGGVPVKYAIEVSLNGETWERVADSYDRVPPRENLVREVLLDRVLSDDERLQLADLRARREEVEKARAALPKIPRAYVGRFQQPTEPVHVLIRGNPMTKGDVVRPGSMSTLASVAPAFELDGEAPEGERRLALARWISQDANPLTPRVLANRVWHYHFGRGLVATPSDFGFNGAPPTHPKLLDWLARRLHVLGWRLKPLHKEIMLSMTYRQASDVRTDAAQVDRDALFLWRFPARRLAAEEVRDSMLAVAGTLDRSMGGPGFRLYRYTVDNVATYLPLTTVDESTFRRSVYHQHARSVKVDLLGEYDCPDSALAAPRREVTTSPLQALTLLNGDFVLRQAQAFAERVEREVGGSEPVQQVERAFVLAFGRPPMADELERSVEFVKAHGLFVFCRALLNANEFVYVM